MIFDSKFDLNSTLMIKNKNPSYFSKKSLMQTLLVINLQKHILYKIFIKKILLL